MCWWAQVGSNHRPLACKASALPLSYAPGVPAGASGRIYLSGRLPANARSGRSTTLTARAIVAGTSQRPGTANKTVPAKIAVHPAPPAPAGTGSSFGLPLLAGVVVVFLLGGGLLVGFTLRRARATRAPAYQGHRRRTAR